MSKDSKKSDDPTADPEFKAVVKHFLETKPGHPKPKIQKPREKPKPAK